MYVGGWRGAGGFCGPLSEREWSGLEGRRDRVKLRPAGRFTARTGWCYRLEKTCRDKVRAVKAK